MATHHAGDEAKRQNVLAIVRQAADAGKISDDMARNLIIMLEMARPALVESTLEIFRVATGKASPWDDRPLHCIRCHNMYINSENGPEACTIKHNWDDYEIDETSECEYRYIHDDMCREVEQEWNRVKITMKCCNEQGTRLELDEGAEEEDTEGISDFCIVAAHTTDPSDIDWDVEEDALLRTCEQKGCKGGQKGNAAGPAAGRDGAQEDPVGGSEGSTKRRRIV